MERVSASDRPQYDINVVDEAVVNAVAHRDYAIAGSKIRLFLFADRLELYSPGKLPNTITLDDMAYRTFTRNQLLVSFLSRIRSKRTGEVFLESRGEGVRKILQDGEAHAGRRPEYELFGDELRPDPFGELVHDPRYRHGVGFARRCPSGSEAGAALACAGSPAERREPRSRAVPICCRQEAIRNVSPRRAMSRAAP